MKTLPDGLMSNKFVGDEAWVAWRMMAWYVKSLSPWGDETQLQPPGFVEILWLLRPLDFSSQPFEDISSFLTLSRFYLPTAQGYCQRANDNA